MKQQNEAAASFVQALYEHKNELLAVALTILSPQAKM